MKILRTEVNSEVHWDYLSSTGETGEIATSLELCKRVSEWLKEEHDLEISFLSQFRYADIKLKHPITGREIKTRVCISDDSISLDGTLEEINNRIFLAIKAIELVNQQMRCTELVRDGDGW
jgi:hypothetical protein